MAQGRTTTRSHAAIIMLLVVLGAGAAGAPAASATETPPVVGTPTLRALAPEFAFQHTSLEFNFVADVDCEGGWCYDLINYQLLLNPTPLAAVVSPTNLTGGIGSGTTWAYGASGLHAFEGHAWVGWITPGEYAAQVAVRPHGATGDWAVSDARPFHVLSHVDNDWDGVSDDLERRVCAWESGALQTVNDGMDCSGGDLSLSSHIVLARPQPVPSLTDADADGFPDSLRTYATRVGFTFWSTGVTAGSGVDSPFDTWAGAQLGADESEDAAPRIWCAPLPMWTGAGWARDDDWDGIPARIVATTGQACIDPRDAPGIIVNDASDSFDVAVDLNDSHYDEAPVGDVLLLETPLFARFGPDADADGLPDASFTLVGRITTPAGSWGHLETETTWRMAIWDDTDDDEEMPWLYVRSDADRDRVPDGSEWLACAVEDRTTPVDGSCTHFGNNFHPPPLYVSAYWSPSYLADEDRDGASDGAEALACDTSERWLFFPLCWTHDDLPLPPLP